MLVFNMLGGGESEGGLSKLLPSLFSSHFVSLRCGLCRLSNAVVELKTVLLSEAEDECSGARRPGTGGFFDRPAYGSQVPASGKPWPSVLVHKL